MLTLAARQLIVASETSEHLVSSGSGVRYAAVRAVNAGYEGVRIRGGRCGLRGSSGGWREAANGGA